MVKVRLLGNAKKAVGSDLLTLDSDSVDDIVDMLKEKGVDTNELLILVNGVELSLANNPRLSDDDMVTIASVVHGG